MADENTNTNTGTNTNTTTTTTTPVAWTESLGDDLKGYVNTKGFKEPKDLAESYRNLEKLQGVPKERLLQLPESLDSADMVAVWERLGAVKAPDEYKFDVPADHVDGEFGKWAKEQFHKLKVPRAMAEGFIKSLNDRQSAALNSTKEQFTAEVTSQQEAIKKEWGGEFEKNQNIANQTAKKFGLNQEDVLALGAALGPGKALKFLHKLGEGLGEEKFVQGGAGGEKPVTASQAENEIKSLIKDSDFRRRLQNGDSEAKNKWDRLHKQAFQGQLTI